MTAVVGPPVFERIVGQPLARTLLASLVDAPVHALLFVGPAGSGKRAAAAAFAAALVCPEGGCGSCAACRDALLGVHPDVVFVERHGPAILVDEAREVVQLAQRAPQVAPHQVLVLEDFHLVDRAGPALLKTIEEPPDSTVIVVLADHRARALATIASRCLEVPFSPLSAEAITAALVAEGAGDETAAEAAAAAAGRLDRARLLVSDPNFAAREARWRSVPDRLDGTGATVVELTDALLQATDELVEVLRERQASELRALEEAAAAAGLRRAPERRATEERHRREQRQVRSDELRAGLATLAASYRSRLDTERVASRRVSSLLVACQAIDEAAARLGRNVNEVLLVDALLCALEAAG